MNKEKTCELKEAADINDNPFFLIYIYKAAEVIYTPKLHMSNI
jgi:hypothetical protein